MKTMVGKALALTLFSLWWLALALGLKAITLDAGDLPVDYRTYATAAGLAEETGSPYPAAEEVKNTWLRIHQSAIAVFRADQADGMTPEVVSGPYLYPPSLALTLGNGRISAQVFLIVHTLATIALGFAWLKFSYVDSALWLLPMALSIDLIAVFAGGNIEIILIALSLFACRFLWQGWAVLAALAVAPVLLVKPQFALLFLAFGSIWVMTDTEFGSRVRPLLVTIAVTAFLVALEVLRWPDPARSNMIGYLQDPGAFQYMTLPLAEQWPMNLWNRAPLQIMVNAGLPFGSAQTISLGLFLLLLTISCVLLARARLDFPIIFALAYVLYLIGRPITWSLPMFGVFVLTSAWTRLARTEKILLTIIALAVAVSHWAAFILFSVGVRPGLLTFQTPALPWETLFLLPGAWMVLILASRRSGKAR